MNKRIVPIVTATSTTASASTTAAAVQLSAQLVRHCLPVASCISCLRIGWVNAYIQRRYVRERSSSKQSSLDEWPGGHREKWKEKLLPSRSPPLCVCVCACSIEYEGPVGALVVHACIELSISVSVYTSIHYYTLHTLSTPQHLVLAANTNNLAKLFDRLMPLRSILTILNGAGTTTMSCKFETISPQWHTAFGSIWHNALR